MKISCQFSLQDFNPLGAQQMFGYDSEYARTIVNRPLDLALSVTKLLKMTPKLVFVHRHDVKFINFSCLFQITSKTIEKCKVRQQYLRSN